MPFKSILNSALIQSGRRSVAFVCGSFHMLDISSYTSPSFCTSDLSGTHLFVGYPFVRLVREP